MRVYNERTGEFSPPKGRWLVRFWHYVCGTCRLAWKQNAQIGGPGSSIYESVCPRCGSIRGPQDEVKQTVSDGPDGS